MKKLMKLSMLSTSVALSTGLALGMASGANAQGACSVAYTTANSWGAGAQIGVTVTNTGAAAVNGWELCWTYGGSEKIQNLWDGTFSQTGQNVCVKSAGYNGNLAVNGKGSFGFIVNNPGAAPTAFTFNGASCGGSVTPPSSVAASSSSTPVVISSSRSSSSVSNGTAARWLLDATKSTFHFVTVKKNTAGTETPENITFSQLEGTVAANGQATLTIPLASVSSGIDLRNTRLKEMLFESQYLPSLHFTTQLDLTAIGAMAPGSTTLMPVTGTLMLHGVAKSVVFEALVVKHANNGISVSPRKPIVINATDFDLNAGVESLRTLMSLTSIGEKVPVYFKMFLNSDNPTNVPAIALPTAPATPLSLAASVNSTGTAAITWSDVSANETGFLVRRKGADGRWVTASNKAANSVNHNDILVDVGSYDYKLISYADSVPSVATAPVNVVYIGGSSTPSSTSSRSSASSVVTTVSSSSIRSSVSSSSVGSVAFLGDRIEGGRLFKDIGCAGCHIDPEEDGVFKQFEFDVNAFTYHTIDKYKSFAYTGTTVSDLSRFIAQNMFPNAPCNTPNCSDHLAAYLYSLKGKKPVVASCDVLPPVTYGVRSLRLLTSYEYGNSLKTLLPSLTKDYSKVANSDVLINHLPNHTAEPVSEARLLSYKSNAEEIAAWALATPGALPFTCGGDTQSATCAAEFVNKFAYPAFRRPLTSEEVTEYTQIVRNNATGLRWAIQTVLMSPQFLYRTELGVNVAAAKNESWGKTAAFAPTLNQASTAAYALDPYEFASALSYMYQASTPDNTLLQAAASGALDDPRTLELQINRLIDSPLGRENMGRLAGLWFRTDSVVNVNRPDVTLTAAVKQSMAQEIREIYKYVFYNNRPFTDIYKGEFTMLNKTLSDYYGIPGGVSDNQYNIVNTMNSPRGGVLASGAFMTVNAHSGKTSPIFRAVHVRQDMLCQSIPLPPPFDPNDRSREDAFKRAEAALAAGTLTTTDFFDIQTNVGQCAECHKAIINPLFALDDFDNIGKPRRIQNGRVVQPALDLAGDEKLSLVPIPMIDKGALHGGNYAGSIGFTEVNGEFDSGSPGLAFKGAKGLGNLLATENLQGVNACLINKSHRYAMGYPISNAFHSRGQEKLLTTAQESALACVNKELNTALNAGNNNPRAMMKALGMSKALRFRQ